MKLREPRCDSEYDRLAQRMAKLEEKLFQVMERNAQLEEENTRLRAEVERLGTENARLQQQLAAARKDSSTSSKPPSSDIVKPKKPLPNGGKKRKKGGQPGHDQHLRSPFPPEAVDHFESHTLDCCPDCGGTLVLSRCEPEVLQQVEITATPTVVTEHRGLAYWCPHCRKVHYAPMPEAVVKAGLFGPRLTALVGFMKGVCHASFSTIRKFLRDVVRVDVCRGYLAKLIGKVSQSLAAAYAELFQRLPGEAVLNIDETGHKENGQKFWTWCFRAQVYTLFRIDKSRGSKVLLEVLGEEFNGVLGCDYFSAYRKYMREFDVLVQFCMAHLIRDVKFLLTLPGREVQAYGQRLRDALRDLFGVIHRREKMTAAGFQKALEAAREQVMKAATTRVPDVKHARNLAKRFRENGEAYFRFITTPGIDPTNNLAEQAIRFVVIDRHITQGTRSEKGRRWCERIWTVIATCAQQGRAVFQFLLDSVQAHLCGTPPPSLLPSGP
jgi:transposase